VLGTRTKNGTCSLLKQNIQPLESANPQRISFEVAAVDFQLS